MGGVMSNREKWIDYTKVFACILVAVGHFFMSMTEAGIISETPLHDWFITTIYYFHVPLFFVCSGYLYQKNSRITSVSSRKKNVFVKAVTLGVPYFVFSLITWILKAIFAGSVNSQNSNLLVTLFMKPASPYWYLYILFFAFLVTPVFAKKSQAVCALAISVILYYIQKSGMLKINVYAITETFCNLVWFVLGMCFCLFDFSSCWGGKRANIGIVCAAVFLLLSCVDWSSTIMMPLIMGLIACTSVIIIVSGSHVNHNVKRILRMLSGYTMPIYLMHTIFAAGIRSVLLKLSITNHWVHIVIGLAASLIGPIFAADIMTLVKLDVLMYPGKYLKK